MICFLTALYYEAKDIIRYYKMKKVMEATKFQVFRGKNQLLIISGTGGVKALVAATYLLSLFGYNENDIFINVGICGSHKEKVYKGEVFLCNKLIDSFSKKSFYPDMLFRHPFSEGTLESFAGVVDSNIIKDVKGDIVDQEGAFVYQAASMFLKPENIYIIKIVSDILNPSSVTPRLIEDLITENMPKVYAWLEKRSEVKFHNESTMGIEENNVIDSISKKLKLTTTMDIEFKKLCKQYKIRNERILHLINEYRDIKCNSKNEGKKIYGELKARLMEL